MKDNPTIEELLNAATRSEQLKQELKELETITKHISSHNTKELFLKAFGNKYIKYTDPKYAGQTVIYVDKLTGGYDDKTVFINVNIDHENNQYWVEFRTHFFAPYELAEFSKYQICEKKEFDSLLNLATLEIKKRLKTT